MGNGYLVLSRKLFSSFLWEEKRVFSKFEAFMYLLYHAQYGKEQRKVLIKNKILIQNRGELLRSQRRLASDFGWSQKKVHNWLKMESDNATIGITLESVTTRITILNYNKYQEIASLKESDKNHNGIKDDSEENRDGKQKKTSKTRNYKYPENYSIKLKETFDQFISNREQLKKPVTDLAFTKLVNKLNLLSNDNESIAITILNNSIESGWSGLFKLNAKDNVNTKSTIPRF